MAIAYLLLSPNSPLPDISFISPFRSVVVIEDDVTSDWQSLVCSWLVKSGCLYLIPWGRDSSTWDEPIEDAMMDEFTGEDSPDDKSIIFMGGYNESLREVFWFSKNRAFHPAVELKNTLILHIASENRELELLWVYASA